MKEKIQIIITTHGFTLTLPRAKTICNAVRPHVFTGDLYFYTIVLGKEGISPHFCFDLVLITDKWRDQSHPLGTKRNISSLKVMYKKSLCLSKGGLSQ